MHNAEDIAILADNKRAAAAEPYNALYSRGDKLFAIRATSHTG